VLKSISHNIKKLVSFILICLIASCSRSGEEVFMRDSKMSYKDLRKVIYKDNEDVSSSKKLQNNQEQSLIPTINKSVISLPPPTIGGDKMISFYVDDKTPIKDALIELGRVAEVDIDIDPKVSSGIIINAKNRPFKEILDRIASQAKLRYTYKNRVLYFEPNYPYLKNYIVDFLGTSKLWEELQSGIENIFNTYATQSSGSNDSKVNNSKVILNKTSGIVTVFASSEEHEMVQKFIDELVKQGSAQVLIEAKILEIGLYDEFRYGIDWAKSDISYKRNNAFSATTSDNSMGFLASPVVGVFGKSIDVLVGMVEGYGVTRSISNPRIHAMNNTTSTLKFSDKLVYFQVQNQQSTTTSGTGAASSQSAITSTKMEEDQGTEISITPSINLKTEDITLIIEPKITRKTGDVQDPASSVNKVPVMNERTMSTTVKIKNGNVVVIGGLMNNSSINSEGGFPVLAKIPIIGWFFKSSSKDDKATETVILLRATLVSSNGIITKEDRDFSKIDPSTRKFR